MRCSFAIDKSDPDALGKDKKPLLVGAGVRLTKLFLAVAADHFKQDCRAIKEAKDPLVKQVLHERIESFATKVDPKEFKQQWLTFCAWQAAQDEKDKE